MDFLWYNFRLLGNNGSFHLHKIKVKETRNYRITQFITVFVMYLRHSNTFKIKEKVIYWASTS